MSLIKSISGIRGTIGGTVGDALTPVDIVGFAAAYARQLQMKYPDKQRLKVVVGRDARTQEFSLGALHYGRLAHPLEQVTGQAKQPRYE